MKTLNGYEVVDEKARERLDTLVIPTKTSQLENDSQFTNKQYVDTAIETAKPDLTGYYTQAQTDAAIQTAIGNIDIPTVPTNVSAFTNDAQYTNKTYVDNAVASVDVSAQLTEYAKKTELPTKVSQLQNDAGYLTEHQSLAGYATETYVDGKIAEIPATDLSNYYTKTEIDNKGYLTAVPDTYALKTDIPDVSSFTTMAAVEAKGYQTASQVNTLIDEKIGSGGSTTQKDWKWVEGGMMYSGITHARFVLARGSAPDVRATVDVSAQSGSEIINLSYDMYYYIPDVFGILKTDNYSTYSRLAIKIMSQQCYIYVIGNDGETNVNVDDMNIVGYYYWG